MDFFFFLYQAKAKGKFAYNKYRADKTDKNEHGIVQIVMEQLPAERRVTDCVE